MAAKDLTDSEISNARYESEQLEDELEDELDEQEASETDLEEGKQCEDIFRFRFIFSQLSRTSLAVKEKTSNCKHKKTTVSVSFGAHCFFH